MYYLGTPLFAEADATAWIVAGCSALVTLLTTVGAGVMSYLVWRDKHRRDAEVRKRISRKGTMDEWKEIVARQDQQIAQLQEAQDHCRHREGVMTSVIVYLHGFVSRQSELMRKSHIPAEEPMSLKDLLTDLEISQFQARSLKQNSALLHEAADRVKENGDDESPSL